MGTDFDRWRGNKQGRIIPAGFLPSDGNYAFALGVDGEESPFSLLTADDYTEIKQSVDLTDVDVVSAVFNTRGRVLEQYTPPARFDIPSGYFLFQFDRDMVDAGNWVRPGFDLFAQGDLEVGVESYSPNATRCRVVPVGSTTAFMRGTNNPQFLPVLSSTYTLQFWMNFLSDEHAGSQGVDPVVFDLTSAGVGGLKIFLKGVMGPTAHEWNFAVEHINGGSSQTVYFLGHTIDASPGWHLYSIVFSFGLAGVDRLKLYEDATLVSTANATPTVQVAQPNLDETIQVLDPLLYGGFDQMMMIAGAKDASQISDDFDLCTVDPTPTSYKWVMTLFIDGHKFLERTIEEDEQRRWSEFVAPVRQYSGVREVAFRLTYAEA